MILTIIFVFFLFVVLSSSLRRWLLSLIVGQLQRRMAEQVKRASEQAQKQHYRSSDQTQSGRGERSSTPRREGKLNMSEIEAKRFEQPSSDEYVDFEEVK